MLEKIFAGGMFLLHPKTKWEFLWKLPVLCALTTLFAISTEGLIGTEISSPIPTYFAVVFMVSAPFFSFAMVMTKRMVKLQEDMARLASTDLLTGLNNRRAFFAELSDTVSGQMAMLDVDYFKRINDNYGHDVGDQVLVAVASHMKTHVGNAGVLARMGGEEFALFTPQKDEAQFLDIMNKLISGVTVDLEDTVVAVTLSAGWAKADRPLGISDLIKQADEALYTAKRDGRACVRKWRDRQI